jgi:DNA replication protein DnaC
MRNELSKKSLKIIDKGVAFHYNKIHQLYFDGVFDDTYSQQKVFESGCLPIVKDVLKGNNASLFVYGQTGTGKTFTMGTL